MKIVADCNIPFVAECFGSVGEVTLAAGSEINAELVRDADILLVRSVTKVDEALLGGSSVKFAATATIGVDHVDVDYLAGRGIGFASAPGSNANSVAEYVTAALLEVGAKKGMELCGKSIGIIGVGNVGSRVEKKALALGMKVVLNDPPLGRQTGDAKYRDISEVMGCDVVTFHVPLTREGEDATYHLADGKFFAGLKDGCVFLNTSRGGVVETAAVKGAIGSGKLGACVLDVWENEPVIDCELLGAVDIGTPHIAGYSYDGKVCGMVMIYKAACEFFGLEAVSEAGDFLPVPIVERVEVASVGEVQEVVRGVVGRVYDIMADDGRMRGVLGEEADTRGDYFRGLRKKYPVRREFYNTTAAGGDGRVREILSGLGFKCDE
jgi:erythronate-4-phosphate dehydrogenase